MGIMENFARVQRGDHSNLLGQCSNAWKTVVVSSQNIGLGIQLNMLSFLIRLTHYIHISSSCSTTSHNNLATGRTTSGTLQKTKVAVSLLIYESVLFKRKHTLSWLL